MTEVVVTNKGKVAFYSRYLWVPVCLFLLSSCSSDNQDLLDKFEQVKEKKGRPIESMPEVTFVAKFVYPSHLKRRNPFYKYKKPSKIMLEKNKLDVNAPILKRKKDLLERFKLKDLRMVGTLQKNNIIWGVVITPNNKIYKVTVGRYLGENYGKVVEIDEGKIKLIEKYKEKNIWQKRITTLALYVTDKKTISHKNVNFEEIVR